MRNPDFDVQAGIKRYRRTFFVAAGLTIALLPPAALMLPDGSLWLHLWLSAAIGNLLAWIGVAVVGGYGLLTRSARYKALREQVRARRSRQAAFEAHLAME